MEEEIANNVKNENNNKFKLVINFFQKFFLKIISIVVGIIGVLSIFITAYFNSTYFDKYEKTFFRYDVSFLLIAITIITIFLIILLSKKVLKKVSSKILVVLLLILDIFVFFFWVKTLKLEPDVDQNMINKMAIAFLDGKIDGYLKTGGYLFIYPFQFGFTFFVSIIYKIFGEDFIYIEYVNVIFSLLNVFLIYYISKLLFKNENIQRILTFLLGGFSLYLMFFNTFFYGNILGLTLALVSVLFTIRYLNSNKKINLFFSGIFIALSIIIKSNYNIFLCGIALVLVLDIIRKWKLKTLLIIPIFLIGYFIINIGYTGLLKYKYNIELPKGIPMITYVYMGMADIRGLSAGWYTRDTLEIYKESDYDNDVAAQIAKEKIQNRLNYFIQNPNETLSYYTEKIESTWFNPTFQMTWVSSPGAKYTTNPDYALYLNYHQKVLSILSGEYYKIIEYIFNIYQIIIFIFSAIGLFISSKDLDLKKALIPIIFFGGFLFHIIWETKALYVIQYYFILLPFAAYGLNEFSDGTTNILNKIFKKLRNNKKEEVVEVVNKENKVEDK